MKTKNKFNKNQKSKSTAKLNTNKKNTNLRNNSIKKIIKSKLNQNTSIRSNGNKNYLYSEFDINNNNSKNNEFYAGNDYDIKKYKNEIIHLKNTINRLRIENDKLKKNLQNERRQNKKFRQLTEEIIKHYEKTK